MLAFTTSNSKLRNWNNTLVIPKMCLRLRSTFFLRYEFRAKSDELGYEFRVKSCKLYPYLWILPSELTPYLETLTSEPRFKSCTQELPQEWNMYSPKFYQILEDNIDTKSHQKNKKHEIDISFYGKIFFCFKSSSTLNQDTKQSSSIQCR